MIACTAICVCSLDLQEESASRSSPWRPIGYQLAPRLPRVLLSVFSEKQPFKGPRRLPAMVKRESLELGAQRNWLLTRTFTD
jgi:hypothetical protein